jgi:hypothetical protein
MTILQMTLILLVFHRALRIPRYLAPPLERDIAE